MRKWPAIIHKERAKPRCFVHAPRPPGRGLKSAGPGEVVDAEAHAHTQDFVSDRPGRGFTSAGGKPHIMEPRIDWHRFEKRLFAKGLAAILDKAASAGAYERLILVAPPQTLGDLRAALGKHARDKVTVELPKDLTKLPEPEIAEHLSYFIRI
ncbi:MAG: host attachment protein [Rhodospirillales bacterium]|nr:host attachment protein [Rhodospirillales bacterium]